MAIFQRFVGGLKGLIRSRRVEQELDEELQAYLESSFEAKVRAGMTPEGARRAARVAVGSLEAVKDRTRGVGWEATVEQTWRDVRYGARTLRRSPAFAVVVVVTLTLGIGVNTAMFSVVDGVLLKPLTYQSPDRLVTLYSEVPRFSRAYPVLPISAYYITEWRRQAKSIEGVSGLSATSLNLTGAGDPERLNGARISADFFALLGVQPQFGRNFLPEEDQPDKWRVAILSDGLWRRRFSARPQNRQHRHPT